MKLLTWNIQWGRGIDGRVDLARIVATARQLADFDVLCVMEVADNFPGLEGNDERDQFAELASLLTGFHGAAVHAVDVLGPDGRRRRFGNAIFSRFDMLSLRRHALPWPADPGRDSMPRVAVEATLQAPLGPLRVTATHLEYYSDLQRRAQAARLRELQDEAARQAIAAPAPLDRGTPFDPPPQTTRSILVGDFNFPPDDAAYAAVTTPLEAGFGYRDAWRIVHGHAPHPPTFCLHERAYSKTPYCCDFAFVSEDLAPLVRGVHVDVETQASDHQPVLLELDDR